MLKQLISLLRGKPVGILTGAGCSTESGIPDYRGPTSRPRRPVQYFEFVHKPEARRRYWARSVVGWRSFAHAAPNPAHHALASLEARGTVTGLITQNVDGLHGAAGTQNVVELHGSLHRVTCLGCGLRQSRQTLQEVLLALNPECAAWAGDLAPDGDAELEASLVERFRVPSCRACGGVLKPDVVFFGENVAPAVVTAAFAKLAPAEVLLVVGSSLTVFSGFRFVRAAHARGVPVVMVNMGPTRGDDLATLCVDAKAGELLPALVAAL